eukprot:123390_1
MKLKQYQQNSSLTKQSTIIIVSLVSVTIITMCIVSFLMNHTTRTSVQSNKSINLNNTNTTSPSNNPSTQPTMIPTQQPITEAQRRNFNYVKQEFDAKNLTGLPTVLLLGGSNVMGPPGLMMKNRTGYHDGIICLNYYCTGI